MPKKNDPTTESDELPRGPVYIEYWPLSKILRWPRNPKLHDEDALGESFERFGFVMPGLIDEKTGRLVAGHGRANKLQALKDAGQSPPKRILQKEGEWYMPITRGVSFENESEAEAYLLADNRLSEIGGWNETELVEALQKLPDLKGLGWTEDAVASLSAFVSMLPAADSSYAMENLNFEPPPIEPRVIIRCRTPAESKKVQAYLGIDPVDPERVLFDYVDTCLSKRRRK